MAGRNVDLPMLARPRALESRMPKTRGVLFDTLEEARAAFALGPVTFRCNVCGCFHRSAGNGWRSCAQRLAIEWGLFWDGTGVRPLAYVFSRWPPLSPPVLGSPQVVLSVRREVLAGAVRDARAAWERAMEQALRKLGAQAAGEFAWPGRWQKAYSLCELEAAGVPESIVSDIRSTYCWARGTEALVWRGGVLWVVAIADAVERLTITRGVVWAGGGRAVWWVLASTASAENLLRWMVRVLHAAGGQSGGGL